MNKFILMVFERFENFFSIKLFPSFWHAAINFPLDIDPQVRVITAEKGADNYKLALENTN